MTYTFGLTFADLVVDQWFHVLLESEIPPAFTIGTAFIKRSESMAQAEGSRGGGLIRVMPDTRVFVYAGAQ